MYYNLAVHFGGNPDKHLKEMDQEKCSQCRKDTSPGSGRFVNRIPSGTDELEGYLCPDCQLVTCEVCNQETIEYEMTEGGTIICDDCLHKETQ